LRDQHWRLSFFLLPLRGKVARRARRMRGIFTTAYCLFPAAYSLNKPVQPFNFLLQYASILNQDLTPVDFHTHDF